jgi:hypothetical protein
MSASEKQSRMDELFQSALNPSQRKIDEWLNDLNGQISEYECRYQLSSSEMKKMVELGWMPETNDICSWLKLLGKRNRFEARQSKAST